VGSCYSRLWLIFSPLKRPRFFGASALHKTNGYDSHRGNLVIRSGYRQTHSYRQWIRMELRNTQRYRFIGYGAFRRLLGWSYLDWELRRSHELVALTLIWRNNALIGYFSPPVANDSPIYETSSNKKRGLASRPKGNFQRSSHAVFIEYFLFGIDRTLLNNTILLQGGKNKSGSLMIYFPSFWETRHACNPVLTSYVE
jgi:hypothetical protein